jgi:hypothetical protein
MTKREKEKSSEYTRGSWAAFMEAAKAAGDCATAHFLNRQDQAADALREMRSYFLEQAKLCNTDRDEA